MAENNPKPQTEVHAGDALQKTPAALREEAVMAFWDEHNVFEQTLKKESPQGNFVFYDGPPYATGLPHFGHIIPSTIKDIIPRYKTMQGYHVPRKWGWDCHGLPIENLIEKELGLKDKRAIEEYGIAKFNKAAKDSVFRYDVDWKRQVKRAGRWVDMDNDYHTMDTSYTESVWWSFKTLNEKGLVYRAHKVMPFCPRCQTSLSNFEVGQGYKDIPDISAYVLFELTDGSNASFLAWTTTPWTLPGNSALAVNGKLEYSLLKIGDSQVWVASVLIPKLKEKQILKDDFEVVKTVTGKDLAGISYKPVFDFYSKPGTLDTDEEKKRENAWKVYTADFVTSEDGTGIVHIAPAFGDDDYKLSTQYNIPVIQHVSVDGHIKEGNGTLSGLVAKPKNDHQLTDIEVIKLLAHSNTSSGAPLLFAKEKIVHSYPHCWRCETPLLNYATSSWFVKATDLKDKLVAENEKVNWVPQEVGKGRFGKWLENVRDWAVSRSRYWGSPIPVWRDEVTGESEFIGSVEELKEKIPSRGNSITVMRHGECESNVKDVISSNPHKLDEYALTEKGRGEVEASAQQLKFSLEKRNAKIVKIYASDFRRTRETAEHMADVLGVDHSHIVFDARLREVNAGVFDGQPWSKRLEYFKNLHEKIFNKCPDGESVQDVKRRVSEFLYEIDSKHDNEHVLVVTHGLPLRMMLATTEGVTCRDLLRSGWRDISDPTASLHELAFKALPHNEEYELDLHRPFIDDVTWVNEKGNMMKRVPEVFDVWYDSGAMPFAQNHYPFENKELFESKGSSLFPADFIAEGLDQTRGWFYSLMVLSVGLFGHSPYKSVVVNGLMLAEDGRKMSKSLRNYPDMDPTLDKYGVDSLRYFIAASPAVHGEEVLFSEKGLDEVNKKIFNRLENVYSFFEMYSHELEGKAFDFNSAPHSKNILDHWIVSRLSEIKSVMEKSLDAYQIDKASRPIADFVDDLSTWYVRRSRDRFKGDDEIDKVAAIATTRFVLFTFTKMIAPFVPFIAESIYLKMKAILNESVKKDIPLSVHLCSWPALPAPHLDLLNSMSIARQLVESGLALRSKSGVKVRQPLASFTYDASAIDLDADLLSVIADELNVKEVLKGTEIKLDTELTNELKEEGMMRDVIRAVQDARKKAGLTPGDIINLSIEVDEELKLIINKHQEFIKKPVLAEEIKFVDFNEAPSEQVEVEGKIVKIAVQKV